MLKQSIFALGISLASMSTFAAVGPIAHSGGLQFVKASNGREVLANAKGATLYTYDPDKADQSVCNGGCLKEWPAVAPVDMDVTAPFGTLKRSNGTTQLSLNHKPLYTYEHDAKAGDVKGDGLGKVWHIVTSL